MLETKIEELIQALNANTAALLGKASAQTELPLGKTAPVEKPATLGTKPTVAAPTNEPTVQEWRALAQKLLDAGKKSEIDKINQKHGLKRITEAHSTDKAAAVFSDLNLAVNAI